MNYVIKNVNDYICITYERDDGIKDTIGFPKQDTIKIVEAIDEYIQQEFSELKTEIKTSDKKENTIILSFLNDADLSIIDGDKHFNIEDITKFCFNLGFAYANNKEY